MTTEEAFANKRARECEEERNSREKEKERSRGREMEREFGEIENGIREKVGRRRERARNAEVEKFKKRGRGRT